METVGVDQKESACAGDEWDSLIQEITQVLNSVALDVLGKSSRNGVHEADQLTTILLFVCSDGNKSRSLNIFLCLFDGR